MSTVSAPAQSGTPVDVTRKVQEAQKLMMLVRAYMTHGHMLADVDPLKLYETYNPKFPNFAGKFKLPQTGLGNLLDYKSYGFSEADLNREFYVDLPEMGGLFSRKKNWKELRKSRALASTPSHFNKKRIY